MGPIGKLFSSSPDLKKTEANKKAAKSEENRNKNTQETGQVKSGSKDQVQISSKARELLTLKMEAESYIKEVKESDIISSQEIDAIKERIASKYYFDEEVISDLVDRLVSLPNYMDYK